ncbi:hypothetical protein IV203_032135 [Nitzschia inconspicua]|uniref:Uncharacterized protein n=1 Tax=Nitzschia inconspicua TaxID=303405 RepID=A0A9K3LW49_9STRA|nr:hypothetical protein IV203_032135 [Nitzschia inconspicua]
MSLDVHLKTPATGSICESSDYGEDDDEDSDLCYFNFVKTPGPSPEENNFVPSIACSCSNNDGRWQCNVAPEYLQALTEASFGLHYESKKYPSNHTSTYMIPTWRYATTVNVTFFRCPGQYLSLQTQVTAHIWYPGRRYGPASVGNVRIAGKHRREDLWGLNPRRVNNMHGSWNSDGNQELVEEMQNEGSPR